MEYQNGGVQAGLGQFASGGIMIKGNSASSSLIREATEAVQQAQARVEKIITQLRATNDEAFGAVPVSTSGGNRDAQPATSKADNLRRATQALHEVINYLEAEANRLGQL